MNPNKTKPTLKQFNKLYDVIVNRELEEDAYLFGSDTLSLRKLLDGNRERTLELFELLLDRKLK